MLVTMLTIGLLCIVAIFPGCRPELKPYVDQEFETLDNGISFYEEYANDCHFDTRRFGHKFSDGVNLADYCMQEAR